MNLFSNLHSRAALYRIRWGTRRIAVVLAGVFACLALLVGTLIGQQTGDTRAEPESVDRALEHAAFAESRAIYAIKQQDPEFVKSAAVAAFSLLNPAIANELRRQDPEVRAADEASIFTMLNPEVALAENRKDPEFRRLEEAARAALLGGAQ